jgi:hypothetical protein
VEHSQFSCIYEVKSKEDFGDSVVDFLADALRYHDQNNVTKLVLQFIPLSFTCFRTIHSIAKGIRLSNKEVKIIFVSSFLTYFSVVSQYINSGVMAILSANGKIFTCRYSDSKLMDIIVRNSSDIDGVIYVDDCVDFGINLARKQREALNANVVYNNSSHIRNM